MDIRLLLALVLAARHTDGTPARATPRRGPPLESLEYSTERSAERSITPYEAMLYTAHARRRQRLPRGTHVLALTDGEQHEWDGMRFPLAIGPKKTAGEGSLPELISWVRRNRATLLDLVARNGAVLLRDFGGLADAAGFSELVHALQLEGFASGCSAAPRTEQAPGVFTANEAPPQEPIPFHHEMAQCEQPPSYICFFCEVAPPSGGATPIIPSHQVADYLRRTHPQFAAKLAQLGVRYVRILPEETDLTSPLGKSWKATFNVNTREDAEAAMRAAGVEWEWREGGDLKTISKPMAALITNKANGRETFFNAIVAASTGWVDKRNQPEKAVIFGDSTPLSASELDALADIGHWMRQSSSAVKWRGGDVLLIDNAAVLHSRQPFDPPRRVLASLWGAPLSPAFARSETLISREASGSAPPAGKRKAFVHREGPTPVIARLRAQLNAKKLRKRRNDGVFNADVGVKDVEENYKAADALSLGFFSNELGTLSAAKLNSAIAAPCVKVSVADSQGCSIANPMESDRAKIEAALDGVIKAVAGKSN